MFRYGVSKSQCWSRARRLAESNRCSIPQGSAPLHGSRSSTARAAEFVTAIVPSTRGVTETVAGCLFPCQEVGYSLPCDRRRVRRGPRSLHVCAFRNRLAARVCAQTDAGAMAFADGVAGARRGRQTGVGLGSVLELPGPSRLRLRRRELVRDPAGEPMPAAVARPSRFDVAGSGAVAAAVCRRQVRTAFDRAGVPACARLVLTKTIEKES